MLKRLLIVLAVLIIVTGGLGLYLANQIFLRHDHPTVTSEEFDKALGPDAVRSDINFLLATLKKIHPDFEAIGGAEFERRARELVKGLSKPMTRVEIYRYLAPLNGLLTDGHTSLRAPAEERDAHLATGGRFPPFTLEINQDGLVIDKVLTDDPQLQAGDEITTINGVPARDLGRFSMSSQSGESIELRRAYAQRFFYRDLWAAGVASPFTIEMQRDHRAETVRHDGLSRAEYLARRDQEPRLQNAYRSLEPGIGLLTFNDMPPPNTEFRAFLKSTFATIRQDGVDTLIVDMRENGGGDSRAGDALMAFLSDHDLPGIEYVEVKVTEEIKDYYQTLLPRGFRWIPLHRFADVLGKIRSTEPGETFLLHPDASKPAEWDSQPGDAFEGEVIVLIGPRTYSSAVIFAAPLKHFGRATFVGEETGEPLIFFGENYYFDLPNSKLEAQVSHKKFVLVGARDARTGVVPDIVVSQDQDALAVALDLISEKHDRGNDASGS